MASAFVLNDSSLVLLHNAIAVNSTFILRQRVIILTGASNALANMNPVAATKQLIASPNASIAMDIILPTTINNVITSKKISNRSSTNETTPHHLGPPTPINPNLMLSKLLIPQKVGLILLPVSLGHPLFKVVAGPPVVVLPVRGERMVSHLKHYAPFWRKWLKARTK